MRGRAVRGQAGSDVRIVQAGGGGARAEGKRLDERRTPKVWSRSAAPASPARTRNIGRAPARASPCLPNTAGLPAGIRCCSHGRPWPAGWQSTAPSRPRSPAGTGQAGFEAQGSGGCVPRTAGRASRWRPCGASWEGGTAGCPSPSAVHPIVSALLLHQHGTSAAVSTHLQLLAGVAGLGLGLCQRDLGGLQHTRREGGRSDACVQWRRAGAACRRSSQSGTHCAEQEHRWHPLHTHTPPICRCSPPPALTRRRAISLATPANSSASRSAAECCTVASTSYSRPLTVACASHDLSKCCSAWCEGRG